MARIKTYYKFADDGRLMSTLHLDDAEGVLQENVTLDPPDFEDGQWPWRVGDTWEARPMETVAPPIADLRRTAYPPVADQLDMLWHAMDRGEIPVAETFYEAIKMVKDAHPKPPTPHTAHIMPEA